MKYKKPEILAQSKKEEPWAGFVKPIQIMEIKLGQKVRCKVTGIQGIVTSKCEYLNGCLHYGVTPLSSDGKYPETSYIDYQQLEIVNDGILAKDVQEDDNLRKAPERRGGPQNNSPKH